MSHYTLERQGEQRQVTLQGDLTASLVPTLQAALQQEIALGAVEIVFDLRQTALLDSSGIGLLVAACNSLARKQGRVRVVEVSPDIHHLLQSMRLVTRLNVTPRP